MQFCCTGKNPTGRQPEERGSAEKLIFNSRERLFNLTSFRENRAKSSERIPARICGPSRRLRNGRILHRGRIILLDRGSSAARGAKQAPCGAVWEVGERVNGRGDGSFSRGSKSISRGSKIFFRGSKIFFRGENFSARRGIQRFRR